MNACGLQGARIGMSRQAPILLRSERTPLNLSLEE